MGFVLLRRFIRKEGIVRETPLLFSFFPFILELNGFCTKREMRTRKMKMKRKERNNNRETKNKIQFNKRP